MAIAFRESAVGTYAERTSLSVAKPTGTVSGDVMLVGIYIEPKTIVPAGTGWTQLAKIENAGSNFAFVVFAKKNEGEAGPYEFTWGGTLQSCTWLTGSWSGAALPSIAAGEAGNSTAPKAASVTTLTANALLVFMAASQGQAFSAQPAGFTSRRMEASWDIGDKAQAVAGASGAATATMATGPWTASQIALEEAVAGAEGEATAPAAQTTEQNATVNLSVTTAHAASMTASELPTGLSLVKSTESLWKIEGKPTTPKGSTTVTLKPRNGEGVGKDVTFTWKINELKPTLVKPADQTFSTSGAISPLIIIGTNIGAVKGAPSVPAGLTLSRKSSTELELKGTPTTVKAVTAYTFEVETTDKTGTASTGAFNITIVSGPAEPAGTYKFKLHGTTTKRVQFWKENGTEVNFTVSTAAAYGTNDPIEAGALEELVEGGVLDTWP